MTEHIRLNSALKQSVLLEEALRDSPLFRAYLRGYETTFAHFSIQVQALSKACDELKTARSSINKFYKGVSGVFNGSSAHITSGHVLQETMDLMKQYISQTCANILQAFQELEDSILRTAISFFKQRMLSIDDRKRSYHSKFDVFESNLLKSVANTVNEARRGQSPGPGNSSNALSDPGGRSACRTSAVECAFQMNLFRIETREQFLDMFRKSRQIHEKLANDMQSSVNELRSKSRKIEKLIAFSLNETVLEKQHVKYQYDQCITRCSSVVPPPLPLITDYNIIILQGFLLKQPHIRMGSWSRRYFYLIDDRLIYHRERENDFRDVARNLNKTWFLRAKLDKRPNAFEIHGPSDGSADKQTMVLQTESREEFTTWFDLLFSITQNAGSGSNSGFNAAAGSQSNTYRDANDIVVVDRIILPDFAHDSPIELFAWDPSMGNDMCCECGAFDPAWGVTSLGITVCGACADVHKTLPHCGGPGRVASLTLDEWRPEVCQIMRDLGNKVVLKIFEAYRTDELEKPIYSSSQSVREKWIIGKYVERRFVRPMSERMLSVMGDALNENLVMPDFDPNGKLFDACGSESCDVTLIVELLSQGADPTWRNPKQKNQTPLHNSAVAGKLSVCEMLLQHGAKVGSQDQLGRSPLHLACQSGNRLLACLLLNHGADPYLKDEGDESPIDVIDSGDKELICILKSSVILSKARASEATESNMGGAQWI